MAEVRIDDHSDEYMRALEDALPAALEAVGSHIEGEAKDELSNTPKRIDTGNLRNSINYQVKESEKAVYVGTNVEYALYVHEGTSRMDPNRFLKNAVDRNRDQIDRIFKDAMG